MDQFVGLSEAVAALGKSRKLKGHLSAVLRLRLQLYPYSITEFPELDGSEFGMADRTGVMTYPEERPDGLLVFNVGAVASLEPGSGVLTFLGPFVYGSTQAQFLYLNWRKNGTPGEWLWRRKFSLQSLAWAEVIAADKTGDYFLFDATGWRGHSLLPVHWERVTNE